MYEFWQNFFLIIIVLNLVVINFWLVYNILKHKNENEKRSKVKPATGFTYSGNSGEHKNE
jgi:hypothetical protein